MVVVVVVVVVVAMTFTVSQTIKIQTLIRNIITMISLYHLSEGIIRAIQLYRPSVVTRLDVRRRGWSGKVLAVLINAGMPPRWLLKIVHGIEVDALPPVDLIVSSGAETLAANIAFARLRTVPNIFYGSLRWFRREDFALVLTSYAQHAKGNRHLMV